MVSDFSVLRQSNANKDGGSGVFRHLESPTDTTDLMMIGWFGMYFLLRVVLHPIWISARMWDPISSF